MRLKYIVLSEVTEEELLDYAVSSVKSVMADMIKLLVPFNIKPEGELKIATSLNTRFSFDEDTNLVTSMIGARGSQYFTGDWLSFLHAERAGVIPRQKPISSLVSTTVAIK